MKKNMKFRGRRLLSLFVLLLFVLVSCTTNKNRVYERIKSAVDGIRIIDTHEHLISEDGRLKLTTDVFYLLNSYIKSDLISSGMTEKNFEFILQPENSLEERWDKFYPYWEKTKNTGYAQYVIIAVRDLFGIEDINEDTYKELNDKLLASNKKGWYEYVLKKKALIDVSILDPLPKILKIDSNNSKDYFVKVKRFDRFVVLTKNRFYEIEKQANVKINTLTDLLNVLDTEFQKAINEEGIVGIKSGLAYRRILRYEDIPQKEAENIFNKMFQMDQMLTVDESKKLEDFMMYQVIGYAVKYDLPIQIHTGMLAGNWRRNPIENTNAAHLSNLFLKYKNAKFVIFHGSYPYMRELSYLAKSYPNVYIDMCWMHIISPLASKQYLEEWLLTVPANKIMAFGGDFGKTVEGTYGHSVIARKNVTEVLVKLVEEGYYTEEDAIMIAKRILRKNALELYKLKRVSGHFERLE
ncbi:hypothetical protein MNBD_BACTEROID01-2116 [hydrothermal vent metagenome]|uniref:Amidohydrolase-related domain-containing protein n=1 Tax=hydrothermal vent metagenome TaxID=652676 RepID=A0A3B0TX33_9ZZZZ